MLLTITYRPILMPSSLYARLRFISLAAYKNSLHLCLHPSLRPRTLTSRLYTIISSQCQSMRTATCILPTMAQGLRRGCAQDVSSYSWDLTGSPSLHRKRNRTKHPARGQAVRAREGCKLLSNSSRAGAIRTSPPLPICTRLEVSVVSAHCFSVQYKDMALRLRRMRPVH